MLPAEQTARLDQHTSDAGLVIATRGGDMTALSVLYQRHSRALMAVAFRLLGSRERAEDVVHDVFVGLPEALRKYDERGTLLPWLKRVTARVALGMLRRERIAGEVDIEAAGDLHARAREPESRMSVESALAAIPDSLRAVVVLKEIEGFSHAEIADMLGISRGASEVRLHRALAAMRAHLTKGDDQ
jgi:RNA polymerase sigma-70 factor, ECF subfamily